MYKIVTSGYFGYNNMGDEAILKGLIEGIQSQVPNSEIVVLSGDVEFTQKHIPGVRAVERMNFLKVNREMKNMDLFISGGGSLLQDVTSSRSIQYYLGLLFLAKVVHKKKTMIYSQGIGPVNKQSNRKKLRKILNRVDWIDVRDDDSKKALQEMGITKEISVTADTVVGMTPPSLEIGKKLLTDMNLPEGRINLGISVRKWKTSDEKICSEITELISILSKTHRYNVVLIPFHFNEDMELITKIFHNLKEEATNVYVLTEKMYVQEYLSFIGNMDVMVAMRLHGLIFATVMGCVPIGISYDPKIDSFFKEIDSEDCIRVEDLNAKRLYDFVEKKAQALEENKALILEKREFLSRIATKHNIQIKTLLEQ